MKIGIIGLGRMGFSMAERLLRHDKQVVVYNRSFEKTQQLIEKGAEGGKTLEEFISKFGDNKRIIWLMLPAGEVTDAMIEKLIPLLQKGDIIINGANSFYKNAQRQSKLVAEYGIHLFDAGVSGGVHGLERGYALMIGGPEDQFHYIEDFVRDLAPEGGYGYFGNVGAGHFVKSVHNVIEYVFMEGLAEGFDLLSHYPEKIDLLKAAKTWQPASIVSSALLDWTVEALQRPDFNELKPDIGSVTIEELTNTVKSVETEDHAKAFMEARNVRCCSAEDDFVLGKRIIAAIRREFGGHAVVKK